MLRYPPMHILDLYHQFGIPFLMAVVLTLFKLLAAGEVPSLDNANDTALDLIFICIGAISVIKDPRWTGEAYLSAFGGNLLLAAVLLTIRGARIRQNAKLVKAGNPAASVGVVVGVIELLMGVGSIFWTLNPP